MQLTIAIEEDCIRGFATASHRSEESDIARNVEHWSLEGGQRTARDARCGGAAQCDRCQFAVDRDKHAGRGPAAGECCDKGDSTGVIEGKTGAIGEVGDALASGDDIPDYRKLADAIADCDEQTLFCLAAGEAGEKGDVAFAVAWRGDRPAGNFEAVEAAAGRRDLAARDESLQRRCCRRGLPTFAGGAPAGHRPNGCEPKRRDWHQRQCDPLPRLGDRLRRHLFLMN